MKVESGPVCGMRRSGAERSAVLSCLKESTAEEGRTGENRTVDLVRLVRGAALLA
jgi:hypothetical protein